jgi:hypothetical protein
MEETEIPSAADAAPTLVRAYVRERISPHPLLARFLPDAALCLTGSAAVGTWDEDSDLDLCLVLPDEEHTRLATGLREAHLWEPRRDFRLFLRDREPFRRFPGAGILIHSASQLRQSFRFDLPVGLWTFQHAVVIQDPLHTLEALLSEAGEKFAARLPELRCEHYYRFRAARNDLAPRLLPRQLATVLTIERGDAIREALRLAFLAEGKPYPYDKWLEIMAERETECGPGIVTAVRALITAREPHTIDRASKVLRDRVAFALQQGGVRESWLEQWWLWPSIAPVPD